MMNKALRDRETQLKGTDLFCSLRVTCAFRTSRFSSPEGHQAKTLFTPVSQQASSANGGTVPLSLSLFVSSVPHFITTLCTKWDVSSVAVTEPVLCQTLSFFSRGFQCLRRSGTKKHLLWWPVNVSDDLSMLCKSLVFKSPLRREGVDMLC